MAVLSPTWAPPVVATAVIHAGVPDIYHSFIHSFKNRNLCPSWRLWFGGAAGRYLNNHSNKCKIRTVTSAMKGRNLDPWNTVKRRLDSVRKLGKDFSYKWQLSETSGMNRSWWRGREERKSVECSATRKTARGPAAGCSEEGAVGPGPWGGFQRVPWAVLKMLVFIRRAMDNC